jgi:hypothetical protein
MGPFWAVHAALCAVLSGEDRTPIRPYPALLLEPRHSQHAPLDLSVERSSFSSQEIARGTFKFFPGTELGSQQDLLRIV